MKKLLVSVLFVLFIPFSSLAAITPIERQIHCRTHKIIQVLEVASWKDGVRIELSVKHKEIVLEVLRPARGSYVAVDKTATTSRTIFEEMHPGVLSQISSWCRAGEQAELEHLEVFQVMIQTFRLLYVFE